MPQIEGKIIYSCPFVPPEWIRAHGLAPSRIMAQLTGSGVSASNGVCPYSAAFVESALSSDATGIVVTTACDQMRRSAEQIAQRSDVPVFLMNLPHTWQNPSAHRLYRQELERMSRFLLSLGGTSVSPESLAKAMTDYDGARTYARNCKSHLSARQHSELIASFNCHPDAYVNTTCSTQPAHAPAGVPVALVGGPLVREAYSMLDMIETAGGYVALDATETGERTLPAPFDRRRLRVDPLDALCDAYFGTIPDPMRRPNSELFKWLARQISEHGIRGLVIMHYLWCDTWRAETRRIAEWSGLPILQMDVGDGGLDPMRTRLRLEAFFEVML